MRNMFLLSVMALMFSPGQESEGGGGGSSDAPMAPRMRAKFQVLGVQPYEGGGGQTLSMTPVGADTYGPDGENEDNDFARYTPSGSLSMGINNPVFDGAFAVGQKFYLDFTPAD